MEIELDALNRVTELQFLNDWNKEDIAPYYDGDPLDLHYPFHAWRYRDYVDINGVWFPLEFEDISFSGGDPESRIMDDRNAGKLAAFEAEMEIAETVHFFERFVTTLIFDPSTLILNEPLDDDMFRFDIPSDALEADVEGVLIADAIPKPWWDRWLVWLIVAAVAILGVLASVVYWVRMNAPLR